VSGAWRIACAATLGLLALKWAWSWVTGGPHVVALAIVSSLLLLPPAIAFALRRPRAPLWAGIVALFYFCHGVADARVSTGVWPWLEMALSLAIVFAAGWPGIAAKLAKRRAPPPTNV
jgi:uncharacterized membrane protein